MRKLRDRGVIGIITPAYIPAAGRMEKGVSYLESKGYQVKKGRNTGKEYGYFAGSDAERIADLLEMYADPEVDLIICGRGGWGGLRLVDGLDYDLIRSNPKCLVGYSDITTLQLAIWQKTGVASLSGPMACVEMALGIDPFTERHFWQTVTHTGEHFENDLVSAGGKILVPGEAQGNLLGGCLAMVTTLLGTAYSPDYTGSILFLEDVGEKPYRIDRAFAQLKQAGVFGLINGLILGEFLDCDDHEDEKSFTLQELVEYYFKDAPFPVVTDFPYGHGPRKYTIPIGAAAKLSTEDKILQFANLFK